MNSPFLTPREGLSYHQTMTLQDTLARYEERLLRVEAAIRKLFENRAPIIPLVGNHLIASGGKRLRPLFHLICADLAGYEGNEQIGVGAIIESIHTASLLHDDVVDMADIRRGNPTANSLWGNQVVVLVGDFLYSNALRNAVMLRNQRIMEALSNATTRMTEGELLQLGRIGDPEITEEEYLTIISAKTGALISAACRIGGILGNCSPEQEDALADFGMKIGIVFQMADDILDYMADERDLGKKLGKDIEEGKITLPLLCLLSGADTAERQEVKDILKNFSESGLQRVTALLGKHRSIDESMAKARRLMDEATALLALFPDGSPKDALLSLSHYALVRDK